MKVTLQCNGIIVSCCGEYVTDAFGLGDSPESTTPLSSVRNSGTVPYYYYYLQEGLDGGAGQLKQVARENASPTPFFSFGSLSFA